MGEAGGLIWILLLAFGLIGAGTVLLLIAVRREAMDWIRGIWRSD